jgi:hypothetical protein
VFKFGRSVGYLEGLLDANDIPFGLVQAQVWQRAMALGGYFKYRKAEHVKKAKLLFPELKGIMQENADALLIAEYCWRSHFI